jgi:hypothetical protein
LNSTVISSIDEERTVNAVGSELSLTDCAANIENDTKKRRESNLINLTVNLFFVYKIRLINLKIKSLRTIFFNMQKSFLLLSEREKEKTSTNKDKNEENIFPNNK